MCAKRVKTKQMKIRQTVACCNPLSLSLFLFLSLSISLFHSLSFTFLTRRYGGGGEGDGMIKNEMLYLQKGLTATTTGINAPRQCDTRGPNKHPNMVSLKGQCH